ncbi:MAG TPA: hypothetical protein VJ843_03540 [Candidatus Saccharimonadales bacterium]|nr:hypothetical protein [Candidatus Saccharimonadales bacterium]
METFISLAATGQNDNTLGAAAVALVVALVFVLAGAFAPFSKAGRLKLIGLGALTCVAAIALIWVS